MEITLTPIGLGPWSHTKLKALKNCPLQFYLKYIVKYPVATRPIQLVTEVGKAAHKIIELMIEGSFILDAFDQTKKIFERTITPEEWETNVKILEFNITEFQRKLTDFSNRYNVVKVNQELRLACTIDWKPTSFFAKDVYFRGITDFSLELDNGDIIVIDHKTGGDKAYGVRSFKDQLDTYKVLFHKGCKPITGAQTGIHFIKAGELIFDEYSEADEIDKKLIPKLEFRISSIVDSVRFLGKFKHIAGSHCEYCDFKESCKAGKLKEIEEDSKKWFNK